MLMLRNFYIKTCQKLGSTYSFGTMAAGQKTLAPSHILLVEHPNPTTFLSFLCLKIMVAFMLTFGNVMLGLDLPRRVLKGLG